MRTLTLWGFRTPTLLETMRAELAEAKHSKLKAETGRDWAISMVAYEETRIARLNAEIAKLGQMP